MNWITSISALQKQARPDHPYFAGAFDFMQTWLSGQENFELRTSGSTGTPKPIVIHRKQLMASAAMTGKALQLGKGTRALVCLNISYIAGLMMLVRGLELDWELTIVEPAGDPFRDVPGGSSFDFIAMVPMQLSACLHRTEMLQRTGKILLGGAPVSLSLQKQIASIATPVYQSYGMTETVSHIALRRINGPHPDEPYRFLPGIRAGTDERGCLFVEGDVTNNERVQTNDLVEITGDTFQWIGRADHVINSGGIKIVLDKIDETVARILDLMGLQSEFFAWYEPDEKLGQMLVLIIQGADDPAMAKAILSGAARSLHAYEVPKHIYFTPRFERTATDKVDKRATIHQILRTKHG